NVRRNVPVTGPVTDTRCTLLTAAPSEPAFWTFRTPALTNVVPVNGLALGKTSVPVPTLARLAAGTGAGTPSCTPPGTGRVAPESTPLDAVLASMIGPPQMLLPRRFSSAPPALKPGPLRVSVSPVTFSGAPLPSSWRPAPVFTTVPLLTEPSARFCR